MNLISNIILSVIIMLTSTVAWSDYLISDTLTDYRLTLGIKVNAIDFDVYNSDSTKPNGTLSENFSYSPIIMLGSPYTYIRDSNWGSMMEYRFSGFTLNKQNVNGRLTDLGTSVNGYYVFVTPTLFYSFNINSQHTARREQLIAGMGAGIGFLKADGNIIFTKTTQQLHNFDISGVALAISMFVDYRIDNFVSRISAGLTSHSKNNYDYDAFGFEWDFSYIFDL